MTLKKEQLTRELIQKRRDWLAGGPGWEPRPRAVKAAYLETLDQIDELLIALDVLTGQVEGFNKGFTSMSHLFDEYEQELETVRS